MSFLPTSTKLGHLEILEVYVQYNGPRLFSCKNQTNKIFLGLWVDEEEEYDLWLFMLVSLERLKSIRTGLISLRDSFLESETFSVYQARHCHTEDDWRIELVSINNLDCDLLPLENTCLDLDEDSLPHIQFNNILKQAITNKREFLSITLDNSYSCYVHEFPVVKLGDILTTLQLLLDELSIFKNTDLRMSNLDIRRKTELNTLAFSPGSFKIQLASTIFEEDIFGNSIAGNAIEEFFLLASILDDKKKLVHANLDKKKIIGKYKSFLNSIYNAQCNLNLEWASPTLTRGGEVKISFELASKILESIQNFEFLEEKEHSITGKLFKIDTENWKFGIKDINSGKDFKGDILESARSDAEIAIMSHYYDAKIIELPKLVSSTNELKQYYQLVELNTHENKFEQLILSNMS
jgi:hypothetical protein